LGWGGKISTLLQALKSGDLKVLMLKNTLLEQTSVTLMIKYALTKDKMFKPLIYK